MDRPPTSPKHTAIVRPVIWIIALTWIGELGCLPMLDPMNPPDSFPVAAEDNATTTEDTAVIIPNVLSNDSDADGDALSMTGFTQAAHGTVTQNSDGTFTYTPQANFEGTDTFTYAISDGRGGAATGTVTIAVIPVNDAPVTADDSVVTSAGTPVTTASVLTNDSDPDGDVLSVTSFTQAAHGTVSHNGNGVFTYTPQADFYGTDSFTYAVSDGHGGTAMGTVNVTVARANVQPVAVDDTATTTEDTAVTTPNVLSNDSDADGDTLSIASFTQGAHGTVVRGSGGTFVYTPQANFNGTDSFTYTVSDGFGGSATATVTITVTAVNDAPVAVDDSVKTTVDAAVAIASVLANDSDVDGDTLSVTSFTQPAHGALTHNGDGTFTYTPQASFEGTDCFTYAASDGHGATATATVTITVGPVNTAPVAADDSASTSAGMAVTTSNVLANDSDADGDTLSIASFTQAAHGTVVNNGDGTFLYAPASGYTGTDSFTYTLSDGYGATATGTVSITVNGSNNPPVATDDSVTTSVSLAVTLSSVLANDSDADGDTLSIASFTQPAHGTVADKGSGTFLYTPTSSYTGTDSFTYTVSDGQGGTDTGTVNITVKAMGTLKSISGPRVTEDLAFDHNGYILGGQNGSLFRTAYGGTPQLVLAGAGSSSGLITGIMSMPNGDIIYCDDTSGTMYRANSSGSKSVILSGLSYPNGIEMDLSGMLYLAETHGNRIRRINPDTGASTTLVSSISSPDSVSFDPTYTTLYICSSSTGSVYAVDVSSSGQAGTLRTLATGFAAHLNALAVDVNGNIYIAAVQVGEIWRLTPDGQTRTRIAKGSGMLATVQWGSGIGGWDSKTLYISDRASSDVIYALEIGIEGKARLYP